MSPVKRPGTYSKETARASQNLHLFLPARNTPRKAAQSEGISRNRTGESRLFPLNHLGTLHEDLLGEQISLMAEVSCDHPRLPKP
jgi:hypothetical protein